MALVIADVNTAGVGWTALARRDHGESIAPDSGHRVAINKFAEPIDGAAQPLWAAVSVVTEGLAISRAVALQIT